MVVAVEIIAQQQDQLYRVRCIVQTCVEPSRESLLQPQRVVASHVVADAVALQHHFGRAFQDDAAPDRRSIVVHRNRNLAHIHAKRPNPLGSLPHHRIDRRVALGVTKSLAHQPDAKPARTFLKRGDIIAGLGRDGP